MKKILFVLLALTISHSAIAYWFDIGGAPGRRTYADPERIENYGSSTRSIYTLTDFVNVQNREYLQKPFQSQVSKWVVSCRRYELQVITTYFFSGPMGNGVLVGQSEDGPTPFQAPYPGSTLEAVVDLACTK